MIFKDSSPIKLLYSILKINGAFNQQNRPWSLINSAFHLLCGLIIGICSFLKAYLEGGDLTERMEALGVFVAFIHVLTKLINILLHQTEIRNLFDRLEDLRGEMLQDIDHRHHVITADSFLRKLTFIMYPAIIGTPMFSLCFNLLNYVMFDERHLQFQIWIPWDLQDSASYLKGLLFIAIITTSLATSYGTDSILLFIFTFEISAILKILQEKLRASGPIDKSTYRLHINIVQLIKDYNRLFSGVMYLEIMMSSLQPCGFIYTLIKLIKRNDPRIIDFSFKALLATTFPFFICLCGEEINYQVEKLHESSYMNQWYEEKPKNRKDLLNVMTAAVKPSLLSYRRFVTFNYACYSSVVQGMYSYLTMIVQFETAD